MAYLSTFGLDGKWVTSIGSSFLKWKPPFLTPKNERAENFSSDMTLAVLKISRWRTKVLVNRFSPN